MTRTGRVEVAAGVKVDPELLKRLGRIEQALAAFLGRITQLEKQVAELRATLDGP